MKNLEISKCVKSIKMQNENKAQRFLSILLKIIPIGKIYNKTPSKILQAKCTNNKTLVNCNGNSSKRWKIHGLKEYSSKIILLLKK